MDIHITVTHVIHVTHKEENNTYHLCFWLLTAIGSIKAQTQADLISGQVSFVSSKNVYVKFPSTKNIQIGDTLFLKSTNEYNPALIVTNKSSSSCVCTPLSDIKFALGQIIVSNRIQAISKAAERETLHEEGPVYKLEETIATRKDSIKKKQDVFRGRISLASYSNYSESTQKPAYRFNYTFSLSGNHVNNSKLSFDSYISFRHRTNEWYKVQENINNALKIYTLALQYSFNKSMDLLQVAESIIESQAWELLMEFNSKNGSIILFWVQSSDLVQIFMITV